MHVSRRNKVRAGLLEGCPGLSLRVCGAECQPCPSLLWGNARMPTCPEGKRVSGHSRGAEGGGKAQRGGK